MGETVVALRGITKAFPGVVALDRIDFDLRAGEIHALVGKNGAGKSTLISIISGIQAPDRGEVLRGGSAAGAHPAPTVATVYQESTLFPNLSVADNIFSGDEPAGLLSLVKTREKIRETERLLALFNLGVSPRAPILSISPAEQKVVEILRAVRRDCRVLILDEPTATLALRESSRLFELLKGIRETQVGIIYISHRLEEIFQVADRVTVLRDGKLQGTSDIRDISMNRLVSMMVGQQTDLERVQRRAAAGPVADRPPVLEARAITHHHHKFRGVSFSVYPGEILGIIGLTGAGKTELARTLFGLERLEEGQVRVDGKEVSLRTPREAIGRGIVYVTESRKTDGLFLDMSLRDNISAPVLEEVAGGLGFLNRGRMDGRVREAIGQFDIATTGARQVVNTLSGGNQQKVLLGIWLQLRPRVLMVDEPTVGIDVSAKAEIFRLLRRIADSGTAVILISSETKEVINHSDRILTLYNGRKTGDFPTGRVDENLLLEHISGVTEAKR